MRRWAGVGVILVGVFAHATSPHGVSPQVPPVVRYTTVEATDAGPGRAELTSELEVDVSSLFLYVDSVETPGVVQVQVSSFSSGALLKSGSANVVSPGWVEFPLAGNAPPSPLSRVVLSTTDARVRFRHLQLSPFGFDLGRTQQPPARVIDSGGVVLTGVFRLATGNDSLADPSCGVQGAVAGSPYAFARSVSLAAGPQTQVALAWMPWTDPSTMAVGLWIFEAQIDGGVDWAIGYEDGGTAQLGSGERPPLPAHPSLFPSVPFTQYLVSPPFRIIAEQGPGEWMLVSPGMGLDVCHPAVRAGYGGARAHAEGWESGADFMAWWKLNFAREFCRDDDGDGHAGRQSCGWWGGNTAPAGMHFALRTPDCDDADPTRHWQAGERCDGIDNDCDGVVDELPFTSTPLCSRQSGPCQGARIRESLCVDGGWVSECGAESYGAWYGNSEAACGSSDWNCDGVTSFEVRCQLQDGVCAGAINTECAGINPAACPFDRYGPHYEFYEQSCDALDNDCDRVVDDVSPSPCPLQLGVCEGSVRTAAMCSDGAWLECGSAQYGQSYEPLEVTCDGLDNDCDGLTDGEDPDFSACEQQLGVCAGAHRACASGVRAPCGAAEYGPRWQEAETRCDGLDNDCDGITDEDCTRAPSPQPPVANGGAHCGCTGFDSGSLLLMLAALLLRRSSALAFRERGR